MSDPKEWIAATLLPGVGAATLARIQRAGVAVPALMRGETAWPKGLRLREEARRGLDDFQRQGALYEQASELTALVAARGWSLLTLDDPAYPPLLQQISDPPPVLWINGAAELLSLPQLAIVGSRHASRDGLATAYRFARELTQGGLIVTSGLARGIDAAAHQAAVDQGRATLAVLGTGLDQVYPRGNQRLADSILSEGGAWVSEFAPGTGPFQRNFPRRNRIISGLSVGTWVVEAAPRSGSLITARQALEQGREVFAMPGSVHNPLSRGCHALIREGAHLIETAADILAELGSLLGTFTQTEAETSGADLGDAPAELESIPYDPVSFDQLVERLGMPPVQLQQMLSRLELDGWIEVQGTFLWRVA